MFTDLTFGLALTNVTFDLDTEIAGKYSEKCLAIPKSKFWMIFSEGKVDFSNKSEPSLTFGLWPIPLGQASGHPCPEQISWP